MQKAKSTYSWYSDQLNADNRAYKYGEGLFETIRSFNGRLPLWPLHIQRLERGMHVLNLKWNENVNVALAFKEVQVAANQFQNARIRLQVSRTAPGYYSSDSTEIHLHIHAEALENDFYEVRDAHIHIGLYPSPLFSKQPYSGLKTTSALFYVMCQSFAAQMNWNTCLVCNESGFVCDTGYAGLIVVQNGEMFTPLLTDGGIDSVMVRAVTHVAKEHGKLIQPRQITLDDIREADELFLVNSIVGIISVDAFESISYQRTIGENLLSNLNSEISKNNFPVINV